MRLIGLLLVLLTLALFSPVRDFEFINFDDPLYVTENPHVRAGLSAEGLAWAFGQVHGEDTYWHPVTWVSHMIDCELFGLDASAHHIVNVLLHTLTVLLLFHLLQRMTKAPWRSALVAALFACHPLQVDTVAWVTERKNILAGLFWILTMLAYVRYAERTTPARYALVITCFALGLMSKPVLVTLPFALLLVDFWPLRRIRLSGEKTVRSADASGTSVSLKRALIEKTPLLVLSLISSVVTLVAHAQLGTTISTTELSFGGRVTNAIVSYGRYLLKTVWPANLSIYYPLPASWAGWQITLSFLVIAGVTLFVLMARKRSPYLLIGWLWFLGVSVPTIGLIQASTQAMADRFAYLPLIGLFIAGVWAIGDWLKNFPQRRLIAIVLASSVLLGTCAVTWRQLHYWQNSITVFRHALAVTKDNAVAENNLGTALDAAGQHEEAIAHFREAIRIKPLSPQAYNNLGNSLDDLGQSTEAIAAFRDALRLRPNTALVHNNLGVVLAKAGRYEEARTNFLRAMELKPRDAQSFYLMGTLHLRMNNPRAAIGAFETALQIEPNHLKALAYLARVLAASDDALIRNGQQAVPLAERALALTGNTQPAMLDTAAMAYAEMGRFEDALKAQQAAVEILKPANEPAALSEALQRLALYEARQPYRESCTNLMASAARRTSK